MSSKGMSKVGTWCLLLIGREGHFRRLGTGDGPRTGSSRRDTVTRDTNHFVNSLSQPDRLHCQLLEMPGGWLGT